MNSKLDIDCLLNNLQHSPIFETTKQNIILNIDTPLTSKEIHSKLKKINHIMNEVVNITPNSAKVVLTKGQGDSFKIVLDLIVNTFKLSQ